MKVSVRFTVEVNPKDWEIVYGTAPADVRQDIRDYILQRVEVMPGILESGARITQGGQQS